MDAELDTLFRRIADGNEEAFKEVFDRFYERLFSNALAYTKLREHASDVVQQVFLKLWERRHILSNVDDAEAWLFTANRFQALHVLKKQARHEHFLRDAVKIINRAAETPEDILLATETSEIVNNALLQLTEKQREAYKLSRFEDLTYQQIAERWGISVSTVKEHVLKAVKAINTQLAAHRKGLIVLLVNFFY